MHKEPHMGTHKEPHKGIHAEMSPQETIENLSDLVQLDIDAVEAYMQALKNIDDVEIHRNITRFRQDHERHIDELSQVISQLGGTPPKMSKDWKGFLIKGFTAVRSLTGTEGALKAMRSNEKLTNETYQRALEWPVSVEIKALIQKNYEDERRHLAYIEKVLGSEKFS